MRLFLISVTVLICFFSCKQTKFLGEMLGDRALIEISSESTAHFRGIQAVTDDLVWVSGTDGTVLKTENGGKKWKDVTVPNCEGIDFRDIHALDKNRAWVMSSGNGVKIYYTSDGGENWALQFEDTNPKVFLDGMDFFNEKEGIAYGDPTDGVLDILITHDGGENWSRIPKEELPFVWEDEAAFAASGTGVVHRGNNIWLATGGGERSRVSKSEDFGKTWKFYNTTLDGGPGIGIFSMAFKDDLTGVVVGGNYVDSTNVKDNCAFTTDGGITWTKVTENGPRGYRSCVAILPDGEAIACGRTGIDSSWDFKTWTAISDEGYFTADAGIKSVWFAGRGGKIAVLTKP